MTMRPSDDALVSVTLVALILTASVAPAVVAGTGPDRDQQSARNQFDAGDDRAAENATVSDAEVERAVERSQTALLSSEAWTGDHWASDIGMGEDRYWGVQMTMYYALTLERLDAHDESKREAIEYLLSRRDPDGGWNDPILDYGMVLLLTEHAPEEYAAVVDDVQAEIEAEGYSLSEPTPSARGFDLKFQLKLYYALMSDDHSVEDLFPNGEHDEVSKLAFRTAGLEDGVDPSADAIYQTMTDKVLASALLGELVKPPTERDERTVSVLSDVLLDRRFPDGSWQASPDVIIVALALHETGYAADGPELAPALDWVAEERQRPSGRIAVFELSVWDTAWALRSLEGSGASTSNDTMQEAAAWLAAARIDYPDGDAPLQFRDHGGAGWSYKPGGFSEWDDTAVASTALAPFDDRPADDGVAFLRSVQNADGSWSAYYQDFEPLSLPERVVVKLVMGDQRYDVLMASKHSPDVTGHALETLGRYGATTENDPAVRNAVRYLLDSQADNGLWQGVWGERYTYGTSRVLLGLRAVDADMDRPAVHRATEALVARQNPDGGWGERSPAATVGGHPEHVTAPSTPEQTAWALQALLAGGVPRDHPAVQRGVEYLLETQRPDGTWESNLVMYFSGNRPLYNTSTLTQASALRALSMYDDPGEATRSEGAERVTQRGSPIPAGAVLVVALLAAIGVLAGLVREP